MFFKMKMPLLSAALVTTAMSAAYAQNFNIPGDDLSSALGAFTTQSGITLVASSAEIKGLKTAGVKGNLSPEEALSKILRGTGFVYMRDDAGVLEIIRQKSSSLEIVPLQLAQAATPQRAAVETVTVTSSKLGGADVQSIPIAITALSQEQLTSTQTAGGPDLVKQVPNLTFTKTNFTGYSINIRGIGTQAISVTTDPAVAVALNDIPFIRNHFFEQEFYDLAQAEVLRGPQGTLYGRNATAGVVNLTTAKPTDQFEAMASGEIGNYHQRRFEGMINLPIVDDRLDIRVAGEWTKRQGYSFNSLTDERIDGRDLWSGRVTIRWKPLENLQAYLVWEHFSESDDRMRSAKQLCHKDEGPSVVGGLAVPPPGNGREGLAYSADHYLSQGCAMSSLYSADAFQTPNGASLPYFLPLNAKFQAPGFQAPGGGAFDVYGLAVNSRNLRIIESQIDPIYKAKNDVVELNADYNVTPSLVLTSQTGYNQDFLWSTQDYNRFNSTPGIFNPNAALGLATPDTSGQGICNSNSTQPCVGEPVGQLCGSPGVGACIPYGVYCDPQLGCSSRLVAQDLNVEHAWQLGQEFRLASKLSGPFNFSVGGNYLHYETSEDYYVFINTLTFAAYNWGKGTVGGPIQTLPWVPGVSDNSNCLGGGFANVNPNQPSMIYGSNASECIYIDPNSITNLNGQGHNYFRSQNPYALNSYAAFGEAYYHILPNLKLTGGLRWTEDQKHFTDIPSELLVHGYGYPITGVVNQQWDQFTGRAAVDWTPTLDFTEQTLVYASYAHGYKAGGANPPGAILLSFNKAEANAGNPIHPLTFKPEFLDAFELGSKNTLFDGALTLNASLFYYNYEGYQISEIVDRTAINLNFSAHVKGAELESTWEPFPGLKFNFAGGWEDTALAKGSSSIDLIDRADSANHPDWVVVKPFPTQASNCILPAYVVAAIILENGSTFPGDGGVSGACENAYLANRDPVTVQAYNPATNITLSNGTYYTGFDPSSAPNSGEGWAKDLSGNKLPNAPPFTVSAGTQYSMPLTADWAGTLRADYYWQDYSWARVFNDDPYDRLRGYTNVNLALIFTSQSGWQVMLYDKNVFNTTAITGTFLNSDDSGLTTNVFLTDPKLIGVRVTKNW